MPNKDKDARTKDELFRVWVSKVQTAKDHHTKFKGKEIKQYRDAYEGKQWTDDQRDMYNHEVVDNMVYMVVSTLGPAIGMSRPEIFVVPMRSSILIGGKPEDPSIGAARLKTLIDFMWKKLDLEVEFMKAIDDSLIAHDGAFYTGYDMETYETETEDGMVVDLIESEDIVCKRIDPDFILKDLMSTDPDLKDARWIAIKWQRNLQEVKDDMNLKNTRDLMPNGTLKFDKITERFSFAVSDRTAGQPESEPSNKWAEAVEGWDIWDKKNKNFYSLVLTHDKFLREEDNWPLEYTGNGFPIDMLWYNYNPATGHALADTGLYLSKQQALNFLESLQIDHADIQSNVKLLLDKKKIPPGENVERWAKGPAWSYLMTKGDTSTAASVLSTAPGAGELFNTIQALKQDILAQVGVDQFMVGNAQRVETAGEVNAISQGSTAKHAFRSRAVERFEGKVITKLAKIIQQVSSETEIPLDPAQVAMIAERKPELLVDGPNSRDLGNGQTAQEKLPFMRVDQELLQGEFMFEIKVGSTKHVDSNTEKQEAVFLAQMTQGNPLVNAVELTKIMFEKAGFSHLMSRLLRDPQKVAQEQAQKQQAALQAQMAEPQLKTQTDLQKTQIKSETALKVAGVQGQVDANDTANKSDSDERTRKNNLLMKLLELTNQRVGGNGGK